MSDSKKFNWVDPERQAWQEGLEYGLETERWFIVKWLRNLNHSAGEAITTEEYERFLVLAEAIENGEHYE